MTFKLIVHNTIPLTGRILFATSRNGIDNWRFHEESPVLGPSRDSGDWFLFDSEHVGRPVDR